MASSRGSSHRGDAHLAETVSRLRAELDGLRARQRSQAIIEQAKGLLAGRLACSPEEAFEHLAAMSQHTNMKVIDVAAGLIGIAAPVTVPATRPSAPHTEIDLGVPRDDAVELNASTVVSLPPELAARYHLSCAAMAAAADANELAETMWTHGVQQLGAHAVMLTIVEPDGAVRLVGAHGLPATVVSAWHRVPGSLKVAFLRTAAEGRPWWISRAEAAALGYEFIGDGQMRACLPMRLADHVLGVAVVMWPQALDVDAATRSYLQTMADAAGRRLSALVRAADGRHAVAAAHWIDTVLHALPGSVALLCPVRDDSGDILDWCLQRCSPGAVDSTGRTAAELTGRRLLELYPHAPLKALFAGYRDTLTTGEPFEVNSLRLV
ncbi:hypothetical protein Aab01nite_53700 [Paractinoplanes abujensis]|uniref:ANTAR domain-containing protein n=1 Tax=Paractinoplanes abujensis TaxID=882441 RepID=A0A7W7CUD0_9ACTN|nr:ANTAR domain-containing protein [Actinoplanes abujensis]MBB4693560.1 hypothetical protein [Actinoplanes abujensis]GID21780.1 hypothetical protein Aab01nite_53700 [Actinoplanes abujensis]